MQYYTPTPDYYNDYLMHYGVKGMKWRNHIKKAVLKGKNLYQRGKRKIGLMTGKYTEDKKKWSEMPRDSRYYKTAYKTGGSLRNRGYNTSDTFDLLDGKEIGRQNDATRKALIKKTAAARARKNRKAK